jgi:putative hydrolase
VNSVEQLPYDAHTHTTLSDGRNSGEENVRAAEAAGLRCIALTDHLLPGTPRDQLALWAQAARGLDRRSAISVIPGVEGVILDAEGRLSVDAEDAARVRLVLVDLGWNSRGIAVDPPANARRYEENVLAAYRAAAANPVVDALAHPFNLGRFPAVLTPDQFSRDGLRELARVMVDHNTAFEIMNQMFWWYPQMPVPEFTAEYVRLLRTFAREGVKFVVGSDAHSCGAVGNLGYCLQLMRAADIGLSQLVNLERMNPGREPAR